MTTIAETMKGIRVDLSREYNQVITEQKKGWKQEARRIKEAYKRACKIERGQA